MAAPSEHRPRPGSGPVGHDPANGPAERPSAIRSARESAGTRDLAQQESSDGVCPACGGRLVNEKCKLVCRSALCVYRIVFNCAEY
ncbi:MAG TPA: hypothetical protein VEI94_03240 [Candidatus Bathyarchaeia archaeon]|nr:hypothetical protein [Candidatus Bathyarchaeia archaeon]